MIIGDPQEADRLHKARCQTNLWFTPYGVREILHSYTSQMLPDLAEPIEVYSVNRGPLACIQTSGFTSTIFSHQILNHSETPIEVFHLVCVHLLLHLLIPARLINGKLTNYPPEYWEAEKRVYPQRRDAWDWIWVNLSDCIKRNPRKESIEVLARWKKTWSIPKMNIPQIRELNKTVSDTPEMSGW